MHNMCMCTTGKNVKAICRKLNQKHCELPDGNAYHLLTIEALVPLDSTSLNWTRLLVPQQTFSATRPNEVADQI